MFVFYGGAWVGGSKLCWWNVCAPGVPLGGGARVLKAEEAIATVSCEGRALVLSFVRLLSAFTDVELWRTWGSVFVGGYLAALLTYFLANVLVTKRPFGKDCCSPRGGVSLRVSLCRRAIGIPKVRVFNPVRKCVDKAGKDMCNM